MNIAVNDAQDRTAACSAGLRRWPNSWPSLAQRLCATSDGILSSYSSRDREGLNWCSVVVIPSLARAPTQQRPPPAAPRTEARSSTQANDAPDSALKSVEMVFIAGRRRWPHRYR